MRIKMTHYPLLLLLLCSFLLSGLFTLKVHAADICLEPTGEETFAYPIGAIWLKHYDGWLVNEKKGKLWLYNPQKDTKNLVADWSDRVDSRSEGGLLSIAIDPAFKDNGYIYTHMTIAVNSRMTSMIERWTIAANGKVNKQSQKHILSQTQPYTNHNGGTIAFDAQGYLLVTFGDGGSANDPHNHAQNTTNWLGSILRINVRNTQRPYTIPADNPFAHSVSNEIASVYSSNLLPETYAWGLRNPWQLSVDSKTGEIWTGDVGQNRMEEINRISAGKNYGWRCIEGRLDFNISSWCKNHANHLTPPIHAYDHSQGKSVTGGIVYRGKRYPKWDGKYFFADFISGRFWHLQADSKEPKPTSPIVTEILRSDINPVSFTTDGHQELYVLEYSSIGSIYAIKPQKHCKK